MPSLSVLTASVGVTAAWFHPSASQADKELFTWDSVFPGCLLWYLPFCSCKAPSFYLQISLGSGSSHRSSAALHMLPSSSKHPATQTEILSACPFIVLLEPFYSIWFFHIQNIPVTGKKLHQISRRCWIFSSKPNSVWTFLHASNAEKRKVSQLPQEKICHPLENFPMCSWLYMMLWED